MAKNQPATLDVVDVHVGGDVHRIVLGGIKPLPGATVLDQMKHLKAEGDGLRKILLHEPRGGHPSLFADLVVPPTDPRADAGFIIMELMGYPLISGTNTMSTAIALLETGRIPMCDGVCPVTLEAPGGLIQVKADCKDGKVTSVTYEAQTPSFVAHKDVQAEVPGWGQVKFDVVWTGAFYPIIDASALGIALISSEEEEIVRFAKAFVPAARQVCHPIHPEFGDEGPLSFAVLASPLGGSASTGWERRVCCYEFPRMSVCRCPAGVPSTAAAVQLLNQDRLSVGDTLRTISVFDTDLRAKITETEDYHGYKGARAAVTGTGYITMRSQLVVDFRDPLTPRDGLQELMGH
ncbi:MAG: proline racemase family protein [Alphaproteobacteria bacterium]|nr:proline racemase family protein [Alphaproteobacteria bacterium]